RARSRDSPEEFAVAGFRRGRFISRFVRLCFTPSSPERQHLGPNDGGGSARTGRFRDRVTSGRRAIPGRSSREPHRHTHRIAHVTRRKRGPPVLERVRAALTRHTRRQRAGTSIQRGGDQQPSTFGSLSPGR
ncbi:hypothetical protein V5799_023481, partial [Amblyomma americanum]